MRWPARASALPWICPCTGAATQLGDRIGLAVGGGVHPRGDPVVDPFQDAPEQGVLAPEMVIQRASAHARLAQDGLGRGAVESVLDEQFAAIVSGRSRVADRMGPAEPDIARTLDTRPTVGMED